MITQTNNKMVYGILGLILWSLIPQITAAAPNVNTISVQGYMQKPSGAGAVTNGTYQIAYGVCAPDCTSTSNVLWVQKIATTVTNGLFSVSLTGAGHNLSADATVSVGSNLRLDKSAATLNPALISGISTGAVVVRAYAASTIDSGNPQFDITINSVPTAYYAGVAGSVANGSILPASLDNTAARVIPSLWTLDSSQLTGSSSSATNIATGASAGSVSIGTGATTTQTISIGGNGAAGNTTALAGGSTNGVTINASVNSPTNINTGTSTGTVNISNGSVGGSVSIGTNATAGNTISLVGGATNGVRINHDTNSPTNINTGTSTGAVTIGGNSSGIVAINNGTASGAVNIGTAATTAQTITIGGNGQTNNTTNINGGATNGVRINFNTNSPTNINTGTSTGAVNIGNATNSISFNGGTAFARAIYQGNGNAPAATSLAITMTGLTTAYNCVGSITGSAANANGTVYVLRALATANTCTVTFSGALAATANSRIFCICY